MTPTFKKKNNFGNSSTFGVVESDKRKKASNVLRTVLVSVPPSFFMSSLQTASKTDPTKNPPFYTTKTDHKSKFI